MSERRKELATWLQDEFSRTGKKQTDLARALGKDPAAINRMLKTEGGRKISADEMGIIREFFAQEPEREAEGPVPNGIAELEVRPGMGAGGLTIEAFGQREGEHGALDAKRHSWGIPPRYVRDELRTRVEDVRIVEVLGDSMEPTLKTGDRIFIDTAHRIPSPPAVFAIWDGFSVVVKRLELVPRSDPPKVILISDNKSHGSYEVSLADAQIIGRVIAKVSLM